MALLDRSEISAGRDARASALSSTSLRLFVNLGVDIIDDVQPIQNMLVTEGTPSSPWRLKFGSEEAEKDLGGIIENPLLKSALIKAVKTASSIETFAPIHVENFEDNGDGVRIETDQGPLTARLLIAADGRESVIRRKAGITVQRCLLYTSPSPRDRG